jgi:UDP-N-acetylmuramoylalanine--D-glutamate ligase
MIRESKGAHMDLKGKHVLVVGLGRSGIESLRFLVGRAARVTGTDESPQPADQQCLEELRSSGAKLELGGFLRETFLNADLIILSPGVPPKRNPLDEARNAGIEIISEIELAYRWIRVPILAVTGTNGKTTTTELLGQIFKRSGRRVALAGNIGFPLIACVDLQQEINLIVAEISSFQMEAAREFRPRISIMLNVAEDHLDRYDSLDEYAEIKARIFARQGPEDFAVLNLEDPLVRRMIPSIRARVVGFGRGVYNPPCVSIERKCMSFCLEPGREEIYPLSGIRLMGEHNLENIAAALAAARLMGCPPERIMETMEKFSGLEHRLEWVRHIAGVDYYNDSKATNVAATIRALQSFSQPVILLAGGRAKGDDVTPLRRAAAKSVKEVILFGEARHLLAEHLQGAASMEVVSGLEEAVYLAAEHSIPGDVVLLSPACASFDAFTGYAQRGKFFKDIVNCLPETNPMPKAAVNAGP